MSKYLKYLPGPVELSIFATMAVICAGFVWRMPARDLATSAVVFPLFLGCAIFSLWKHGRLDGPAKMTSPMTPTVNSALPEIADE